MIPVEPVIRSFTTASSRREAGYRTPWRRLETLLVEFTDGPGWRVETEHRSAWTCGPGEGLAVLPGTRHRLVLEAGPCRSTWTMIDCRWGDIADAFGGARGSVRIPPPTRRRFAAALAAQAEPDDWCGALRRQARRIDCLLALDLPWAPPPRCDRRIADLMRAMAADPAHPWRREDLTARADLGPAQLHALFRAATGLGPMAWLTRSRLRLAQALLDASDEPVATIAERCGFDDPGYFARVFRRHSGQTPTGFRRAARAG